MMRVADSGARDGGLPTVRLSEFDAAVFDLDGVVTRTADVHFAAWKDLFDEYLLRRLGEPLRPFTEADYLRFVDGRPRYEGVGAFLRSRGIEIAYGDPDDPPDRETICGLGNRKNEAFHRRLERDGVAVFDSSVALIRKVRGRGLKTALVSSSKNAGQVLAAGGLAGLFDVVVDGGEAVRLGLRGKPHPDTYRHAIDLLGLAAGRAFGVEDAISGVEAIRAAGYGLVIGVDRSGQRQALLDHGADVVVSDLGELRIVDDGEKVAPRLPSALDRFDEIAARIAGKRPAVFLDYDGTLTPIVARPDLAVLGEEMRRTVAELAGLCTVAVVSGRDRADVAGLVGLNGLVYAGSHGFDIAGPGGFHREYEAAAKYLPALDEAERRLRQTVGDIDGVIVERKRYAIAVHYRLVAPDDVGEVERGFDAVAASIPALRKTLGKKVFELRPRLDWNKGTAVLWLISALGLDGPDVTPFYIGDDDTDEDAFVALSGRGIAILVAERPQPTAASYTLASPKAVGEFLRRLVAILRRGSVA